MNVCGDWKKKRHKDVEKMRNNEDGKKILTVCSGFGFIWGI